MSIHAMIAVTDGTEETEAITVVDVLRRADLTIDVVSCAPENRLQIEASRGIKLIADKTLADVLDQQYDMIIIPGGVTGTQNLAACQPLITMLKAQFEAQRWVAAICAAPAVVLNAHHLLGDALVTCHPGFIDQIDEQQTRPEDEVVWDDHYSLITSQGAGTAMRFALALVEALAGEDKAKAVAGPLVFPYE